MNAIINGRIASLKLMPVFVCVPCLKDGIGFVSSSGVEVGIVEIFFRNHFLADDLAEFFYLFPDVS